jgi:hypothetical protein
VPPIPLFQSTTLLFDLAEDVIERSSDEQYLLLNDSGETPQAFRSKHLSEGKRTISVTTMTARPAPNHAKSPPVWWGHDREGENLRQAVAAG